MAKFKIKDGWISALPYRLSDKIGIENHAALNVGDTVEMDIDLDAEMIQMIDQVSDDVPTDDNTKAEIMAYLDAQGIDYKSSESKADLLAKC